MPLRKTFALFAIVAAVLSSNAADNRAPVSTAAELFDCIRSNADKGRSFSLTATVTLPCCERRHRTMAIEDDTGAMLVTLDKADLSLSVCRGDRVELHGTIAEDIFGNPCASCTSIRPRGKSPAVTAVIRNPKELSSETCRYRVVEIEGTVSDAFTDEIDPNYMFIILRHDDHQVTVATESDGRTADVCRDMIGRRISVLGVCRPGMYGVRAYFGKNIRTTPDNIRLLSPDSTDPFAVNELDDAHVLRPEDIASGERKKVRGAVIASWSNGRALIRTAAGRIVRICVSHGDAPEHGQVIEAVGFPETDLYRINLTRCVYRTVHDDAPAEDAALPVTARQLTCDAAGRQRYNTTYHGRRIRLVGRLLGYSPPDGSIGKALLESEGQHIPVYFPAQSALSQRIPVNSLVEIDGTCVMDAESWSPYTFFPRIQEVLISVIGPDRIRIISLPSWWTPAKFTTVC